MRRKEVAALVWWPEKISAGGVSSALISNIDFLATMTADTARSLGPDASPAVLFSCRRSPSAFMRRAAIILLSLRQRQLILHCETATGSTSVLRTMTDLAGRTSETTHSAALLHICSRKQINRDIKNGIIRSDAPKALLYEPEPNPQLLRNVYRKHPEMVKTLRARLNHITGSDRICL